MVWDTHRAQMRVKLGHLALPELLRIPAEVFHQIAADGKEPSLCTHDGYCMALQSWREDGRWWYGAHIPSIGRGGTRGPSTHTSRRIGEVRRFVKLLARKRGDL